VLQLSVTISCTDGATDERSQPFVQSLLWPDDLQEAIRQNVPIRMSDAYRNADNQHVRPAGKRPLREGVRNKEVDKGCFHLQQRFGLILTTAPAVGEPTTMLDAASDSLRAAIVHAKVELNIAQELGLGHLMVTMFVGAHACVKGRIHLEQIIVKLMRLLRVNCWRLNVGDKVKVLSDESANPVGILVQEIASSHNFGNAKVQTHDAVAIQAGNFDTGQSVYETRLHVVT
jgi:hypothetical protein